MGVELGDGRPRPYHNKWINLLLLVGLLAFMTVCFFVGQAKTAPEPNGSSDGRYHTCGYVTEDGVTEHLSAYAERCD